MASKTPKKNAETKGQRGELATVAEACDYLNICRATLFRWRKKGILPSETIENSVRIAWSVLERIADRAAGKTTAS